MIITATGLCKQFVSGEQTISILRGVDIEVDTGDLLVITGESGVGKSTLLHILGLLIGFDQGQLVINGQNAAELHDSSRARIRNQDFGFVFQSHHLLADFTALENVIIPQLIGSRPRKAAEDRARQLLEDVGLSTRTHHLPGQLSGGEQQRVALARALANQPSLVFADEPTGNLDPDTSLRVQELICNLNQRHKTAFVIVTHSEKFAAMGHKRIHLQGGQLNT